MGFASAGGVVSQTSAMQASVVARLQPSRWTLAGVFATAVVVTLIFQATLPDAWRANENSDYTDFYEPVAQSVLAGQGFQRGAGVPATAYPPGYPVMLAGVFWLSGVLGLPSDSTLSAVAAVGMGISALLLYALARRLWRPRAALLAPLLWLTYPFALWLTKQPNSEIPFLVVFYGAWYLFCTAALRRSRGRAPYFLCGLLAGIAMLIRPIGIGVGFLLCALLWLGRRDLEPRVRGLLIGSLLLGNLVAVLPWEVWLYQRTAQVVMLATNGPAGMEDGLTFAVTPLPWREPVKVPAGVAAVMRDVKANASHLRSMSDFGLALVAELRTRPVAVAELVALKAARSWYGTNSARHERAILLIQAGYFLVVVCAAYTAWKRGGIPRQLTVGVGVLVLYFWGMTVLVLSILRYMVPAVGLTFLLVPALLPNRPTSGAEESRG
jgi:4-amino-4-deoxy-L-arabinose transferase-like glycosyltransferase